MEHRPPQESIRPVGAAISRWPPERKRRTTPKREPPKGEISVQSCGSARKKPPLQGLPKEERHPRRDVPGENP